MDAHHRTAAVRGVHGEHRILAILHELEPRRIDLPSLERLRRQGLQTGDLLVIRQLSEFHLRIPALDVAQCSVEAFEQEVAVGVVGQQANFEL